MTFGTRPVVVKDYDPEWPAHFERISTKLKTYLSKEQATYSSIEHVGSTAVPGLAAKPNIDIIILVPNGEMAKKAKEALIHQPLPMEYYDCIGDGGIRGRLSMKLHTRRYDPDQSVYIVREDDPDGVLVTRSHLDLRNTLRDPKHTDLRDEYGQVKKELATSTTNLVDYGRSKSPIIHKILKVANWTDEDIMRQGNLDHRTPREPEDHPF
jgi:GrpB-like predicted nucleotidyltransferase (UPF0157 family)